MEPIRGSRMVRFSGFSLTDNVEHYVVSNTFVVGEYKWCLCLYPNGNDTKKDLGIISMYLTLASDKCLLQVSCSLALVDPSNAKKSIMLCSPMTCVYDTLDSLHTTKDTWDHQKLMERKKLEKHPYYKDDSFTVECTITILKEFRVDVLCDARRIVATDEIVPPFDLQRDLVSLLESGLGADVSFKVSIKTFNAHRCILAARSPVFRAQLYGPMKESTNKSIVIDEIEAPVFKAMLRFMYSDSESYSYLDSIEEDYVPALMAQHLMVAADRYELERLQTICEDQLMKSIDVATVATTLVLAEQHNRKQLRAACLKFMTSSHILHEVRLTEGFEHLCLSCPSIANHLSLLETSLSWFTGNILRL